MSERSTSRTTTGAGCPIAEAPSRRLEGWPAREGSGIPGPQNGRPDVSGRPIGASWLPLVCDVDHQSRIVSGTVQCEDPERQPGADA